MKIMSAPKGPQFFTIFRKILMALALLSTCNGHEHQKTPDYYHINKLEDVKGKVSEIIFDSKFNTHVRTENNYYKLNGQNAIEYKFPSPGITKKLLVNRDDQVYLFTSQNYQPLQMDTLWLIKKNSSSAKKLYSFRHERHEKFNKYFMDKNDIIFFNAKGGAVFIRKYQNVLMRLRNLKYFYFDLIDEDTAGNVYLVDTTKKKNSIFLITKEVKNESSLLYGTLVPNITNEVTAFKVWNHIPLFVESRSKEEISSVKTLLDEPNNFLLSQYEVRHVFLTNKNKPIDRFFFVEESTKTRTENSLYYIDLKNSSLNVSRVNESLLNPSIIKDDGSFVYVVDKEGKAYFAYKSTYDKAKILVLESYGIEFKEIDVPTQQDIYDLAVDGHNDLWILSDELLLLETGKSEPIQISQNRQLGASKGSILKIKASTNEMYVCTDRGLFHVAKKFNGAV